MQSSKKMVFFGSGPVGAATLGFVSRYFPLSAVITKPSSVHGHRSEPPVMAMAKKLLLPIHTPRDKAELSTLITGRDIGRELGILTDYGLIVGTDVIEHFKYGIVNSHFSLLPRWRGADPIAYSLLSGDKVTGVSLMLLAEKMDVGELIAQQPLDIADDDNSQTLTQRLIALSNQLLRATLPKYLDGTVRSWPQSPDQPATYSHKLAKNQGLIDWYKPASELVREVKAYFSWPKSYTDWEGRRILIRQAKASSPSRLAPGTVIAEGQELLVGCGQNSRLIIDQLIVEGRGQMSGTDYIQGYLKQR